MLIFLTPLLPPPYLGFPDGRLINPNSHAIPSHITNKQIIFKIQEYQFSLTFLLLHISKWFSDWDPSQIFPAISALSKYVVPFLSQLYL
jgi:hypothetical protein